MIKSMPGIRATAMVLAMAGLFSVVSAQAQFTQTLEVTIPFDFYAAGKLLPAGSYQAAPILSNIVRLYNPATKDVASFTTMRIGPVSNEPTLAKLVFNKYGDDHFLAEMWWGHGTAGIQPVPTKLEIELARSTRPERVEARARR
jgi:hypothetical protein